MAKTKFALTIISILSLSGCASFDMDMLNPFSSDDEVPVEEQALVNTPATPQASEQEMQQMYQEWGELKPSLTKLVMMESELAKLKQKVDMQDKQLRDISTKQTSMAASKQYMTEKSMSKNMSTPSGNFSIQIAAATNMKAAEQAWRTQLRKFSSFLGEYTPQYSKLMKGSKTFYRVKIGSYSTNVEALNSCRNFQSIGGQCMIRKN